ncbi:MAG: hypothetical protein ACOY90_16320 [Candidatus Zhuqueibacterota bacterium]
MKVSLKFLVIALALSALIFGCDKDNPVDDDTHSEHAEAVGLVITQDSSEIVRYESGTVTGKITVKVGAETPLLFVQFIDEHDGDLFTPDIEHHSLAFTVANVAIAEVIQNAKDGLGKFYIQGKSAGSTTIEIKILHEDHADFVSAHIPVEVTL